MFFGVALLVGGWGVVGWGRKSYLGPAEIPSLSSRDLNRRNKHDSFWLVLSTGYFYILFLWAIVFWKNSKWSTWYISNGLQKKLYIEKKKISVDYVIINELQVVHTWRHTHNLSRLNNGSNYISKVGQSKLITWKKSFLINFV